MRFDNQEKFREIEQNFLSIADDNKRKKLGNISIEMIVYRLHSASQSGLICACLLWFFSSCCCDTFYSFVGKWLENAIAQRNKFFTSYSPLVILGVDLYVIALLCNNFITKQFYKKI